MLKIKQLFYQPSLKNVEEQHRSRVILGMILFYWFSSLIVLIMDQIWGDKSLTSFLLVSCLLQTIPFISLINGNLSVGSISTAIIYLGSITIFASKGLGIRDYALMAYPALILFAGITEKRRGLIISTLLTLTCLAWLVLGERYGWLTISMPFQPDWPDLVASGLLIATSTLMGYMLIESLEASHNRTRKELAERKQVEEKLQFQAHLLEAIEQAVIVTTPESKIIYWNPFAEKLYGWSSAEAIGKTALELIATEDSLQHGQELMDRLNHNLSWSGEYLAKHRNGKVFPIQVTLTPLYGSSGELQGVIGLSTDITTRKHVEAELRKANKILQAQLQEIQLLQADLHEQALRDPLTGLYNRRYLAEMLERERIRCEREESPFSIIVMDIDHFKNINDTYGHSVGDEFLKAIAILISSQTRGYDIACRYGGEEFLLVLPGTSAQAAYKRAEKLRILCSETIIAYQGNNLGTTISFGIATYPSDGLEAEEVLIKADKALYMSKENGRNCVTIWEK